MIDENLPRLVPGQPTRTRTVNRFIEAVERLSQLSVQPPLAGTSGPDGDGWTVDLPDEIDVKLSGWAPPYLWRESTLDATTTPPTWVVVPDGRTGDDAYEYNGGVGLDGKFATLVPVGESWHKFRFPRHRVGPPPPTCPLQVRLLDCGTPAAGATITVTGTDRLGVHRSYADVTDGSGVYTFPDPMPFESPSGYAFAFTWDGVQSPFYPASADPAGSGSCGIPFDTCYTRATVTVTTPSPADATIEASGIPVISQVSSSGGVTVFKVQDFRPCSYGSPLPATVGIHAFPAAPAAYLDNCTSAELHCGDDISVDLTLFKYNDDYVRGCPIPLGGLTIGGEAAGAGFGACDGGCADFGPGPLGRGVTPKTLYVGWSASLVAWPGHPGVTYSPLGHFGDGAPITLTWDGTGWGAPTIDDAQAPWCVAFFGAGSYDDPTYYDHIETGLACSPNSHGQLGLFLFAYRDPIGGASGYFGDCSNSAGVSIPIPECGLTSPVDFTVSVTDAHGITFTAHVTE